MKLILTNHAKERLKQRGIQLSLLKVALKNPALRKPSYPPKEIVNHITEDKTLEIVFEQRNDIVIVITAYYL